VLQFQKEIVFEKGEIGKDDEVRLTKMDENDNLEHGTKVQRDKLDF
jgi:hypothetical protein